MLKSDYIRREHENTLLFNGYICLEDVEGTQKWCDLSSTGADIYHHVDEYETFVDDLGHFSPTEAENAGARYFTIHHGDIQETLQTAIVSRAIAFARTRKEWL